MKGEVVMAASVKKEDVKKVATDVKESVASAATAAKKTAEDAKEVVTAETKKVAEKVKSSAEQTVKRGRKATGAAKKRATKKKEPVTKTAILQCYGNDYKIDEIIAKAEAAFKAEYKRKAIKDIKVYIKPEDNAAYYVVNTDYAGRIDL